MGILIGRGLQNSYRTGQTKPSSKQYLARIFNSRIQDNMAIADEKLCLQWNDFRENVSSAFGDLRKDKDFTDVTLVCEDGKQVDVHKVVLLSSSPFFLNILKKNKHPHPLIYMRGVRSENLMAMVDFFYHGEANVYQENLDCFLVLAEELQLKGLRENLTDTKTETPWEPAAQKQQHQWPKTRMISKQNPLGKDVLLENELIETANEKIVAKTDHTTNNTDIESLKNQVKSMMILSEKADPYSTKTGEKARICKVCGKEGNTTNIMNHIEAKHIVGISVPCGLCGKSFKTRNSLSYHQYVFHKSQRKDQ